MAANSGEDISNVQLREQCPPKGVNLVLEELPIITHDENGVTAPWLLVIIRKELFPAHTQQNLAPFTGGFLLALKLSIRSQGLAEDAVRIFHRPFTNERSRGS